MATIPPGSDAASPFLTLPTEIRLQILSVIIGPPSPLPIWIRGDYTSYSIFRSRDLITLLQLNKNIQEEAKKIFYSGHVFGITNHEERIRFHGSGTTSTMPTIDGFRHFLTHYTTEDLEFIRRLEVTVEISEGLSIVNGDKRSDKWRFKNLTMGELAAGRQGNVALEMIVEAVRENFTGLRKVKLYVHDRFMDTSVAIAPRSENFKVLKKCFEILFGGDKIEEAEIETGGNMDLLLIDVLENSPLVQVPTNVPRLPSGFFHYHLKRSSARADHNLWNVSLELRQFEGTRGGV